MMSRQAEDEQAIRDLYGELHAAWNRRSGAGFAALFCQDGELFGYDGSYMAGPAEIGAQLTQIFKHHQTATYVGVVKSVRMLAPDVGLLRAVAGLVGPGQADINPEANAWQTLLAVRAEGAWRIAFFQNTPAQFHGRPELAAQMTAELRQALGRTKVEF
jgi:uncharacterized protein (TIGR02246 family)